jgi:two-component system, NarL family, invasion response regulator UvrY
VESALAALPQREECVSVARTGEPTGETITVLTVDDQAVFRRAARDLIAATPGFEEVGQAASGPEALELAAALRPDLVLLDVRMETMDGIETARRLLAADSGIVIVLISLNEVPEVDSAIGGGVAAHIRKQDLSPRALREVWNTHGRPRSVR